MWADRIFYGLALSLCTGVMVWAIRSYVSSVLKNMMNLMGDIKKDQDELKEDLRNGLMSLKEEFNTLCGERQTACSQEVGRRVGKLEKHGHVGLRGDDAKITY